MGKLEMHIQPDGMATARIPFAGRDAGCCLPPAAPLGQRPVAQLNRSRQIAMRIAALSIGLATVGCTMGIAPRTILTPGASLPGSTGASPLALPPENTQTPSATSTLGPSPTPTSLGGGGPGIVYHSGPPGEEEIVWLSTAGGSPIDLSNSRGSDITPRFSPDGARIAFASNREASDMELYLMSAEGGEARRLTDVEGRDEYPAWSPDGSAIVFSSNRTGDFEIFRISLAGGVARNLSNSPAGDGSPAYSADGTLVAFASNRLGSYEIFALDLATLEVTRLTTNSTFDGDPSWAPKEGTGPPRRRPGDRGGKKI